jgi:ankyrin repeat protein
MKNIKGADFGVRFYRRAPQKKVVQKTNMVQLTPVKTFKKSVLKMIFLNKVLDDRKVRPVGAFDVSKIKPKQDEKNNKQAMKHKALWMAAQKGDCYALRLLVVDGVDLDMRDDQGRTALNIATQYNQTQAIKTLMAAKEMQRMARLGDLPNSAFYDRFKNKKYIRGS